MNLDLNAIDAKKEPWNSDDSYDFEKGENDKF